MRRLLAAVLAALLVVPLLAAEPARPTCAHEELEEPNWGSVRPFAPRPDDRNVKTSTTDDFVGFAIGQRQGDQAVVADLRGLQVTDDAGCTWEETFAFDDTIDLAGDLDPSSAVILDVVMSDRERGHERVVALVHDLSYGGVARVRTLVSDDGGRNFDVGGFGLPTIHPVGADWIRCDHNDGCAIEIAPSDPDVVYVRLVTQLDTSFHRSTDGGRTFQRRNAVLSGLAETEGRQAADPMAFDIDRDDADTIWATSPGTDLLSTTDGGRRWTAHDLDEVVPGGDVRGVLDVALTPGADGLPVVLAVVEARVDGDTDEYTVITADNGRSWDVFASDWRGSLEDVAGGSTPGLFVATTDRGAHQLDFAGRTWTWLDGSSLGPLADVHPIDGTTLTWFRGPATLPVLGDLGLVSAPLPLDVGFDVGAFDPLDPRGNLPGSFQWPNEVIRLDVGQEDVVDMVFDLPLNRTPLDVFFLFDQSGSMQEEMDALARNMAQLSRELTRRRVDLWVGLGGYSGGWRYQLHKNLGPPTDPQFRRALESLRAGGGFETAYTALHQIATGTGLPDSPAGFGPPEGWNAQWRPGAVRLVVNLTDEPLQVEDSPSISQTIDALVAHRIRVIGLISDAIVTDDPFDNPTDPSIDQGIDEDDRTYGPVAHLARVTGALAGASGVDCGGDGEIDIQQGEPIACYLGALTVVEQTEDIPVIGNLADVMVEVLEGVTELEDISFAFDATGVVRGIEALDPTVDLDIRRPQSIRLQVALACDELRSGQVHTPLVTALASSRHLAAARLTVACGPVALPASPAVPPVVDVPTPAAVAGAPAPPPPAPVQAPAPAQGIAQAANPATAQAVTPQVGVAAAAQKQQQAQAATLGPSGPRASEDGIEFAFSAHPTRTDPGPAVVLAGAVLASAAGAVALRRQRASHPGRVRA